MASKKRKSTGMPKIHWPQALPTLQWQLADREEEYKLFASIIQGKEQRRILLLEGQSNSGKTALMTELFFFAQNVGLANALLDIKGCPSLTELLDRMKLDIDSVILQGCHKESLSRQAYPVAE